LANSEHHEDYHHDYEQANHHEAMGKIRRSAHAGLVVAWFAFVLLERSNEKGQAFKQRCQEVPQGNAQIS